MMSMSNNINKDYQVEDPTDNSQRILIRSTVTGFEQGIAAVAGLFTGEVSSKRKIVSTSGLLSCIILCAKIYIFEF